MAHRAKLIVIASSTVMRRNPIYALSTRQGASKLPRPWLRPPRTPPQAANSRAGPCLWGGCLGKGLSPLAIIQTRQVACRFQNYNRLQPGLRTRSTARLYQKTKVSAAGAAISELAAYAPPNLARPTSRPLAPERLFSDRATDLLGFALGNFLAPITLVARVTVTLVQSVTNVA